jgi:hypothetical protein
VERAVSGISCAEFAELAAAVAVNAADADVVREVERHAMRCPTCARELDEAREAAALLGWATPQVDPPARLKERVLGAALLARPARSQEPARRWWSLQRRVAPVWGAVAAAVLVSIGSLVWAASLQGQVARLQVEADSTRDRAARYDRIVSVLSSTQLAIRPLTAGDTARGASGMLYLDPATRQGMIMVHDLPPLEPDRGWQLWYQRGNERVSGGMLRFDATGTGYTILSLPPDVTTFETVGVTNEPSTGSTWPTSNARAVWARLRDTP